VKRIGAAQFEQQCLALLDTVGPDGIVITRHGRPPGWRGIVDLDTHMLRHALTDDLTPAADSTFAVTPRTS
jgi:hypothetical protein